MQIRFRLEMEFWMRQLIVTEQKNIQPDIVVYNISETFVGNEKKTSIQSWGKKPTSQAQFTNPFFIFWTISMSQNAWDIKVFFVDVYSGTGTGTNDTLAPLHLSSHRRTSHAHKSMTGKTW